ncbi:hypothetical protein BJ508DRAFT_417209 [Ascobolus immersus RN42]|uniref:Uncharacterized protein n=1 Tax=Ascobolus immersus RN42 TaxID=1160509 RepID=A0A3N4HXH5_ASCIM|nr:hypothetical protein BJ508DRAFT_417209 [Ascobolus immersus RN42]
MSTCPRRILIPRSRKKLLPGDPTLPAFIPPPDNITQQDSTARNDDAPEGRVRAAPIDVSPSSKTHPSTTFTSLPLELHLEIGAWLASYAHPNSSHYLPTVTTILRLLAVSHSIRDLYLPVFHNILTTTLHLCCGAPIPTKHDIIYTTLHYFGSRLKLWLSTEADLVRLSEFIQMLDMESRTNRLFVSEILMSMIQKQKYELVDELLDLEKARAALNTDQDVRLALFDLLVNRNDETLADMIWAALEWGSAEEDGALDRHLFGLLGIWPLHYAVRCGGLVRFLAGEGCDVNAKNHVGRTPLGELGGKVSVRNVLKEKTDWFGHRTVAEFLLEHGAVVEVGDTLIQAVDGSRRRGRFGRQ